MHTQNVVLVSQHYTGMHIIKPPSPGSTPQGSVDTFVWGCMIDIGPCKLITNLSQLHV